MDGSADMMDGEKRLKKDVISVVTTAIKKKKKENGLWRDRQECVHVIYPSIYTGNEARHGLLFFAPFLCLKLFIISVTYPASTRKEKRRGDWTSIRKLLSPTTMIPESHY